MIFKIVRDQRTGGEYTDEAATKDKAKYGCYANEAADIEVEIRDGPYHKGTGEVDDPDSADVTGGARVCDDVPYYDPATHNQIGLVFKADEIIELTGKELEQAEEQALEEKQAEAIPEYNPE